MTEGKKRYAACIGGMVSVVGGEVILVPTTFEWADEIDAQRTQLSENRAKAVLENKNSSDTDIRLAKARLKRALIRQSVSGQKSRIFRKKGLTNHSITYIMFKHDC